MIVPLCEGGEYVIAIDAEVDLVGRPLVSQHLSKGVKAGRRRAVKVQTPGDGLILGFRCIGRGGDGRCGAAIDERAPEP